MLYERLADLAALLHALVVLYVGGGLALILLGLWKKPALARAFWFRFSHLALCLIINLFEWANQPCPLTSLENWLRDLDRYEGGFIQHYVSESIHVEVQPRALAGLMFALFGATAALYVWAGPRKESKSADQAGLPKTDSSPTASTLRKGLVLAALTGLALGIVPVASGLSGLLMDGMGAGGWFDGLSHLCLRHAIFLALALALCAFSPRACGLRLGEGSAWRAFDLPILAVWAVPPAAVIAIYANFSARPFHGLSASSWLWGSLAQNLLFSGFIYARLVALWGRPRPGWRGAWAWPLLITSALFALWHWPNSSWMQPRYFLFQLAYTFLGSMWMLNIRRWTGSTFPGMADHVLVNYLASVV